MASPETGPIPIGWPCHGLSDTPPSVADRQSHPTADDLLPQVLALTPRGPAWGTDEAGDGRGASPWMLRFWRAIAAWAADDNRRDFAVATQVFPSAVTFSLPDWETELGLPEPCTAGDATVAARLQAVRARHGALGGASPAYFICLARSLGYDITIEEPEQFIIDESEVGPDAADGIAADPSLHEVSDENVWQYWIVRLAEAEETWFEIDDGELTVDSIVGGVLQPLAPGTPLEGFIPVTDLECLLRRLSPDHTVLVFSYAPAA